MQFITEQDLLGKIKENVLEDILEIDGVTETISGSTVLTEMERTATDTIQSYIGGYFDTGLIFSQTGSTRDQFIVKMTIDIMLYEINCKLTPDIIAEIRQLRYDRVIETLEKISMSKIVPNLPRRDQLTQSTSGFYIDGEIKNNTDW